MLLNIAKAYLTLNISPQTLNCIFRLAIIYNWKIRCNKYLTLLKLLEQKVFFAPNQPSSSRYHHRQNKNQMSSNSNSSPSKKKGKKSRRVVVQEDDWVSYLFLIIIFAITIFGRPAEYPQGKVSLHQVWYFGWITAVATGFGAVPFYFLGRPTDFLMGITNALASGMMVAASVSLVYEGATFNEVSGFFGYHSLWRVFAGFFLGIGFILCTKKVLDQYEDIKFGNIEGASAQRILLIVMVMTLHSMTEGIGIGVSFGGQSGMQLGQMISLSLALHNVPEGLAVALVLQPRGYPKIKSALWCIFTSIPQPLMAIPAFLFVERFLPVLPAGLGFASGAMIYVAFFELFAEAVEDTSVLVAGATSACSFGLMMYAQSFIKDSVDNSGSTIY